MKGIFEKGRCSLVGCAFVHVQDISDDGVVALVQGLEGVVNVPSRLGEFDVEPKTEEP